MSIDKTQELADLCLAEIETRIQKMRCNLEACRKLANEILPYLEGIYCLLQFKYEHDAHIVIRLEKTYTIYPKEGTKMFYMRYRNDCRTISARWFDSACELVKKIKEIELEENNDE